ncbi:phospholipase [Salipaludibacillus neizhouensis]|uniref:Phospholipase n=1 Tax=Salipaludibacillus neizhouensis TaxID=885475 RepID=A0A3A9K366_9BACI|nr:alpha/beta hydrolase [Salipaludibacillus neizhouensis]RKL66799.1 phospholipase [Salipaludibacillus neizhouensis]
MWKWEFQGDQVKGVFVIVHGAGEYHARYKWIISQLNHAGYHVLMGDLPGQGVTQGPRGHIKNFHEYIETVNTWLKKAREYDLPVILLGHSMGGLISTRVLMEMPAANLPSLVILSSPCFGLYNKTPFSKKLVANLLHRVIPTYRVPAGLKKGTGTRDEVMRKRDAEDDRLVKRVSLRWYTELEKSMKLVHEQKESFPQVPLLVMQGGDDRIVNKFEVEKWFNNINTNDKYYKEWKGLYHEVLNEPERDRVLAHMLGFVTIHRQ